MENENIIENVDNIEEESASSSEQSADLAADSGGDDSITEESGTEESVKEESGTEESGTEESGTEESITLEDLRNILLNETDTEETGTEESGIEESGAESEETQLYNDILSKLDSILDKTVDTEDFTELKEYEMQEYNLFTDINELKTTDYILLLILIVLSFNLLFKIGGHLL